MMCVLAKIRPYGISLILTLASLLTTPFALAATCLEPQGRDLPRPISVLCGGIPPRFARSGHVSGGKFSISHQRLIILHTNDEHSAVVPHSPSIDGGADGTLAGKGGIARVATLVERIREKNLPLGTEASLKHSGEALESPLGDFVTDAMRRMVQRKTGERVDLALMSNGLIRGSLVPGQAAATKGQIGFMDMADLVALGSGPDEGSPGYPLSAIYVTGKEVQRLWELVFIMVKGGGDLYFQQMSGARIAYAPNLVELFKIPFWNLRLPSGRALEKIEIFSGDGMQTSESRDYTPIEGDRLYRLVLPSYTLAFLPALNKKMPWLAVVPKNNLGLPLSDLADAVIRIDGHPYKVWQALFDYIQSGDKKSADSLPMIDARYYRPDQRITAVWRLPYWGWAVCLFSVVALIVLLKKLKRGRYFLGK